MSYYYNYYIGYKKDNKIYPLGPYSCDGKINEVLSRSRSFASDLHDDFHKMPNEMITSELRRDFEYENFNGEKTVDVKYLELDKMPDDNFIKSGYFLIEDVQSYLKDKDTSWYKQPDNVVGVLIDTKTGKIATNESLRKSVLYYLKGTEPK